MNQIFKNKQAKSKAIAGISMVVVLTIAVATITMATSASASPWWKHRQKIFLGDEGSAVYDGPARDAPDFICGDRGWGSPGNSTDAHIEVNCGGQ